MDENGRVTGIKEGTVTITAKAGVSGITSKCKVTVWEEDEDAQELEAGEWENEGTVGEPDEGIGTGTGIAESEMYFSQQEYYLEDSSTEVLQLYVNLKEGDYIKEISIDSSNEDAAVFYDWTMWDENRYDLSFTLVGAGTITITAVADNGLSAQCTLTHYIDME